MSNFIRGSVVGHLVYNLSSRKLFQHKEEKPDYIIPDRYLIDPKQEILQDSDKEKDTDNSSDSTTVANTNEIIVTWDGDDDPENPYNWSFASKTIFALEIGFLTLSVYMASAIYTPGIEDIMSSFNTTQTIATVPLAMFVIGYGIGPLIFSPLSESKIGRNPLYISTLFIFFILQIPTALVNNIAGLCVLRFLAGFFASPALSTGGASFADVIPASHFVLALATWAMFAVSGPSLGPLIGSVLVVRGKGADGTYESWRWTFWFMAIISGVALIILSFFLPETYGPALLTRKAERLRRKTGNDNIKSELECQSNDKTTKQLVYELLWRPFEITLLEPVVLLIDIYIALVYSVMYLYFEAIPIVFVGTHHFTLIEMGLTYVSIIVGIIISASIYIPVIFQLFTKKVVNGQPVTPEVFLPPAIVGAIAMVAGIFIYGWTSSDKIFWFVPLIGTALFGAGAFIEFQTLFNYMGASFKPEYLASVFSSNAFFRSVSAGCFPLFGRALFTNLSIDHYPVGWGSSILGFIALAMVLIPVFFYMNGPKLRARSKFAY